MAYITNKADFDFRDAILTTLYDVSMWLTNDVPNLAAALFYLAPLDHLTFLGMRRWAAAIALNHCDSSSYGLIMIKPQGRREGGGTGGLIHGHGNKIKYMLKRALLRQELAGWLACEGCWTDAAKSAKAARNHWNMPSSSISASKSSFKFNTANHEFKLNRTHIIPDQ